MSYICIASAGMRFVKCEVCGVRIPAGHEKQVINYPFHSKTILCPECHKIIIVTAETLSRRKRMSSTLWYGSYRWPIV